TSPIYQKIAQDTARESSCSTPAATSRLNTSSLVAKKLTPKRDSFPRHHLSVVHCSIVRWAMKCKLLRPRDRRSLKSCVSLRFTKASNVAACFRVLTKTLGVCEETCIGAKDQLWG